MIFWFYENLTISVENVVDLHVDMTLSVALSCTCRWLHQYMQCSATDCQQLTASAAIKLIPAHSKPEIA